MPGYNSKPASENEDYFSDARPKAAAPEPEPHDEEEEHQEEGGKTALVPQSLCPGMKPGEEMVVQIDKVLEDQYLVSYAPKKEEGEEGPPPEEAAPEGENEMRSMMA